MDRLKIQLVGPYPPPYGGISVHIQRLRTVLSQMGHDVSVLSKQAGRHPPWVSRCVFDWRWLLRELVHPSAVDIIHLHTFESDFRLLRKFAVLAAAGRPVVVSMHSFRDEPALASRSFRWSFPVAIRMFRKIIAVGPAVRAELAARGARDSALEMISPYLPPPALGEERSEIPPKIRSFMGRHSPVITANAHSLSMYQGADLYGLDMCVDLAHHLVSSYPNLGFVIVLGHVSDPAYLAALRSRIDGHGLGDNFLIWTSETEYWPIIAKADLMVRPTNTDSFGISVLEALDLGVPVVASDVCERPADVRIFRSRDLDHLESQVRSVLASERSRRRRVPEGSVEVADQLLAIYDEVAK